MLCNIPQRYDTKVKTAVVLMLHGSGGNGEKFYNLSGWKEGGDAHNILTVFPSSPQYPCVLDDGVEKTKAEKWSSYDLVLHSSFRGIRNLF
jgi:poly(3-hydroxybutyrate) depolymerase